MTTREDFDSQISKIIRFIGAQPLDDKLQSALEGTFPPEGEILRSMRDLCVAAITEGWMCNREGGGLRFGRVTKPTEASAGFSVDVVDMRDLQGPHHRHPNGEIDLIMPLEGDPHFDGHGAGWLVYGPGTAHFPTVSGGHALVLYLLPGGAIDFTK